MKIKDIINEEIDHLMQEALRDEIPQYMQDIVKKRHGDEYLDMDVPKHTEVIPNTKIEINDDNITKMTIDNIVRYFKDSIFNEFKQTEIYFLLQHRNFSYFFGDSLENFGGINLNNINDLRILYSKEFRLPKLSDQGDDLKFSDNKSNIYTLYKYILRYFKIKKKSLSSLPPYEKFINDKKFSGLREPILNYEKNVEDLKNSKFYLYISDKPEDKLRMSISKFYDSCQNIYRGDDAGTQWNQKLLSNVFDENSKVAYLIFDSPFKDDKGNEHPYTPISRMILRHMKGKIFFDRVYPDDMKEIMYKLVEDNTGLKNQGKDKDVYNFKKIKGLPTPYMDKYSLKNVGDTSELDDRAYALANHLGVNLKEVHQEGETKFIVNGKTWNVYTEAEANEYALDSFRDSIFDHFFEQKIENLIAYNIYTEEQIRELVGFGDGDDEDDEEFEGYDFIEYLEQIGISTLDDLKKYVTDDLKTMDWRRFEYHWVVENANMEGVINYFGGDYEFRTSTISSYDGEEYESGEYLMYRYE